MLLAQSSNLDLTPFPQRNDYSHNALNKGKTLPLDTIFYTSRSISLKEV